MKKNWKRLFSVFLVVLLMVGAVAIGTGMAENKPVMNAEDFLQKAIVVKDNTYTALRVPAGNARKVQEVKLEGDFPTSITVMAYAGRAMVFSSDYAPSAYQESGVNGFTIQVCNGRPKGLTNVTRRIGDMAEHRLTSQDEMLIQQVAITWLEGETRYYGFRLCTGHQTSPTPTTAPPEEQDNPEERPTWTTNPTHNPVVTPEATATPKPTPTVAPPEEQDNPEERPTWEDDGNPAHNPPVEDEEATSTPSPKHNVQK